MVFLVFDRIYVPSKSLARQGFPRAIEAPISIPQEGLRGQFGCTALFAGLALSIARR
jgi:hypothetical protein